MFALMMGAAQDFVKIKNISRDVPKICKDLQSFQLRQTVATIAGLLLNPDLHANTVRIEALVHLACLNCKGQKVPSSEELSEWLNDHLLNATVALAEDPREDVFISNVITFRGNNRIFEGVWESSDFNLQQVLDVAHSFPSGHPIFNTLHHSIELLALSEEMAQRMGLVRFISGGGIAKGALQIPNANDLVSLAQAVVFTPLDLSRLKIKEDNLLPFVMPLSAFSELENASVGHSKLERFPLIRFGSDFIVALPTAIGAAAREFLLEEVSKHNEMEHFTVHLRGVQTDIAFNEALRDLNADVLFDETLPEKPAAIPLIDDLICQFDEGKFAHIVLMQDMTSTRLAEGFIKFNVLSKESAQRLCDYFKMVAKQYASRKGFSGGMTVVIFGGLGGGAAIELSKSVNRWHNAVFSLSDISLLRHLRQMSLLKIWKLKQHVYDLSRMNLEIQNSFGDFNLIAFWHSRNYALVPNDLPLGSPVFWPIKPGNVLELRQMLRQVFDKHAVYHLNPDSWMPVQRENTSSLFAEARNLPIFVVTHAMRQGRLLGVAETTRRPWWLIAEQKFEQKHERSMHLSLWRGFLFWLYKAAQMFDSSPTFDIKDSYPIKIILEYEGIPSNEKEDWNLSEQTGDQLRTQLLADCTVLVRVPKNFFAAFALPDNVGEMSILAAIVHAVSQFCSSPMSQHEAVASAGRLVGSPDARFIHVTTGRTFQERASFIRKYQPRFLCEENMDFAAIGLGRATRAPIVESKIVGVEECNLFLHEVADEVWRRLSKMLSLFDRESVIVAALENIEGVAMDSRQWQLSARALLAIYEDQNDVVRGARNRDNHRDGASLMSRILIEMAVCTCPLANGRQISKNDFDELLANIEALIQAGHESEAMLNNFVNPAEIIIHPSGRYSMDLSYNSTIIIPYSLGHFEKSFKDAAANYTSNFEEHEPDPYYLEKIVPAEYQSAFKSEFGVSAQKMFELALALEDLAIQKGAPIFIISELELQIFFKTKLGFSHNEVNAISAQFILAPREKWDQFPPAGFEARDWYPWAFRRRLSLLRRPIIKLEIGENPKLILSPGLFFTALGYVLDGALEGNFSPKYFASDAMRSWLNTASNENGKAFEELVATEFEKLGLIVKASVPMTVFNAPKKLGDIDVMAICCRRKRVFIAECKRLQVAKTIGEIAEQLKRFQNQADGHFVKHLARGDYLKINLDAVSRFLNIDMVGYLIEPIIVTNTIVPIQFMDGLPIRKEKIFSLGQLAACFGEPL
jgi:hypothetical protein